METLARQMNEIARTVVQTTVESELRDFNSRLAQWEVRQKEKAKRDIEQLKHLLKEASAVGKTRLLVRLQITGPYLASEMTELYKELSWFSIRRTLKRHEAPASDTKMTLRNCRDLPTASRRVACWLIRQGFTVHYRDWHFYWQREEQHFSGVQLVTIDARPKKALTDVFYPDYGLHQGFDISWR